MKTFNVSFLSLLAAMALTGGQLDSGALLHAQTASPSSPGAPIAQSQRATPPDDPDMTEIGFTGVIVKSGDKLVLLDTNSKTSYQLDDQEKAQDFVNKNVQVTGVLDPSTGTIHVRVIRSI